ncbi:MAG: hypothetical protein JXB05_31120, partial [Myxococcaceae bacterium]|nr:hypothetical protein [Myxococcaceae bacterium]
ASPVRRWLWAGLGLLALVAAVGIDSLLRSRTQGAAPTLGVSQETGPVAAPPLAGGGDAGSAVAGAPPVEPATPPESAQVAQASADAGTAPDAGALAAAPPASPGPDSGGKEARPATHPVKLGILDVFAQPYATVLVNGKPLGEVTGRQTFKLAPGNYRVTFEHPRGSRSEIITIPPGGTVKRQFRAR